MFRVLTNHCTELDARMNSFITVIDGLFYRRSILVMVVGALINWTKT